MVLVKEKNISVNGTNLTYYESGTGEVLLFLHGNSSDSNIFHKMYKYFEKENTVIAIDSRGHGRSGKGVVPYSINLLADDIIEFCEKKSLRKITIIGYSDGGNIALVMACKNPEIINKLILICPNIKVRGIKTYIRYGLRMYRFALKTLRFCKIKSSNNTKFEVWKMDLMLKNINISIKDLNKLSMDTLILGAKRDIIYKKHLLKIQRNIKNSI